MPNKTKRYCTKCGSMMKYVLRGWYRCPKEGCKIQLVKFDRKGTVIDQRLATEPIKEYKVTHGIRGPTQ